MQNNLIESETVDQCSGRALELRTEQLETLKNTVKTLVVDSVKTEFQMYSSKVNTY